MSSAIGQNYYYYYCVCVCVCLCMCVCAGMCSSEVRLYESPILPRKGDM